MVFNVFEPLKYGLRIAKGLHLDNRFVLSRIFQSSLKIPTYPLFMDDHDPGRSPSIPISRTVPVLTLPAFIKVITRRPRIDVIDGRRRNILVNGPAAVRKLHSRPYDKGIKKDTGYQSGRSIPADQPAQPALWYAPGPPSLSIPCVQRSLFGLLRCGREGSKDGIYPSGYH